MIRAPPFSLSYGFLKKGEQAMFKRDKVFYKNKDYTVRMEKIDGCEKYYLQFHVQGSSPEHEISLDVFKLYYKDFRKPLDKIRTESRRHTEDDKIDGFKITGKRAAKPMEQEFADNAEFEAILKTCTATQQRRFELYHIEGYTFAEIGAMENCGKQRVKKSVDAVTKKIKKYL